MELGVETHGIYDLKKVLFEDLKQACSIISETTSFDEYSDVNDFIEKMFRVTKYETQFWLDTKRHFLGYDKIVNFINIKCKSLNIFNLAFIKERYWTPESTYFAKGAAFAETEAMQLGYFGESWLLKYLNETDPVYEYVPSGRICLHSIPCVGATPDYLVLYRSDVENRFISSFSYVRKASSIGEVKTTLLPEGFLTVGDCATETELHNLITGAVKNRHLFSTAIIPEVYKPLKKDGSPKVNWLTTQLIDLLVVRYRETCEIVLKNVPSDQTTTFIFAKLKKKVFVNILTSERGKQVLGQAIVFRDNNNTAAENDVKTTLFYLYLNRHNKERAEYILKISFEIPFQVLHHIEKELNTKFYQEYWSKCLRP